MRRTAMILLAGASVLLSAPALAADSTYTTAPPSTVCVTANGTGSVNPADCTGVLPTVLVNTTVPTRVRAQDSGSSLPVTGGDITQLAIIGAGAVALGSVLVRKSRARAV